MGAGSCVGRVGGLAVALGIGAAVLAGAGVAVADEGADSSPTVSAPTSQTAKTPETPRKTLKERRALRNKRSAEGTAQTTDGEKPDADTRPVRTRNKLSAVARGTEPAAKAVKADDAHDTAEAVATRVVADTAVESAPAEVPATVRKPFWVKTPVWAVFHYSPW